MQYLILENLRSAHNVGSLFRTADAAGVAGVYLVGYTPQPIDRFGRRQATLAKTALGATETVPWQYYESVAALLPRLAAEDITLVAVEQAPEAVLLPDFSPPERVAYVLGHEVEGVSSDTRELAATIVEIPMYGHKESLNVAVAGGIILYHGLGTRTPTR